MYEIGNGLENQVLIDTGYAKLDKLIEEKWDEGK